jgi:hypothetical protein
MRCSADPRRCAFVGGRYRQHCNQPSGRPRRRNQPRGACDSFGQPGHSTPVASVIRTRCRTYLINPVTMPARMREKHTPLPNPLVNGSEEHRCLINRQRSAAGDRQRGTGPTNCAEKPAGSRPASANTGRSADGQPPRPRSVEPALLHAAAPRMLCSTHHPEQHNENHMSQRRTQAQPRTRRGPTTVPNTRLRCRDHDRHSTANATNAR